jgi:hypothetical protein
LFWTGVGSVCNTHLGGLCTAALHVRGRGLLVPPPHSDCKTTDTASYTISSKRTAIEDWEGGLELRQPTSTSPGQGDRPTSHRPTHPHTPRAAVGTCWDTVPLFHPRPAVYIHSRVAESVRVGPGTHAAHTPWWERGWGGGWRRLQRSPHPRTHPGLQWAHAGPQHPCSTLAPQSTYIVEWRKACGWGRGRMLRTHHGGSVGGVAGGGGCNEVPTSAHTQGCSGHMLGHSTPVPPSPRSLHT